jgi:hypothetical protein
MEQLNKQAVSGSAFLVGQAQTDFWKWYLLKETLIAHKLAGVFRFSGENAVKISFLAESETCQNALIIEWFDSIGFHIGRDMVNNYWLENSTFFKNLNLNGYDYLPALNSYSDAIKKANEIYNNHFLVNTEADR